MATTYNPPHQITDAAKLEAMIETIRTGGELPPVVVNGYTALTGSHRCAAYAEARKRQLRGEDGWDDVLIGDQPAVDLSNADYQRACLTLGVQYHDKFDCNTFCAALYASAADDAVRDAVEDQIHDEELSERDERRAAAIRRLSDDRVAERYEALTGWG